MMSFISTAVSAASTPVKSFSLGKLAFWVIAAVAFVIIVRCIIKSGKNPEQPEDNDFYLREIRKYVRIIAVILLGRVFFSVIWFISTLF